MENRKITEKNPEKVNFLRENTNYQNQEKKNVTTNPTEIQKD